MYSHYLIIIYVCIYKTHKENYRTKEITSASGTAIEFLSIFVIIYFFNNRNIITKNSILVSFDTVSMFPSMFNVLSLEAVSEVLQNRESDFSPRECIMDALKLCLECNK